MPIEIIINDKSYKISPSKKINTLDTKSKITSFEVDRDYYIESVRIK
ncbi:MAG: hypothetical protein WBF67_03420 [Olleya sp.]